MRRSAAMLPIIAVAMILVSATTIGDARPAGATPYGIEPSGPGYVPDSIDHWYCFDGSISAGVEANRFYNGMDYLDTATTMWDVASSYCGTATDVVFRYQNPIAEAPGARGFAPCRVRFGFLNAYCDRGDVIVSNGQVFIENGGFGGDPATLDLNLHKTVRHEIGHTAGLGHSGGVHALESGPVPYNWGYLAYLVHDICHINNRFGGPPC